METDRRVDNTRRMENHVRKRVKFCVHVGSNTCNLCENAFRSKGAHENTTFHQIKTDLTCYISGDSESMIVDLGCPNTVISRKDKERFIQLASKPGVRCLSVR